MSYYWRIRDGRIWSADQARFVDETAIPSPDEGGMLVPLYSDGEMAGIDYLRRTIVFYGYALGALKNRLDTIQAIQAEYAPHLVELQEAKAGAEMRDDAEGVADIKAEYVALQEEMNRKIQAVPHD